MRVAFGCASAWRQVIRPLTPSSKQTMWKAHDAPVLSAEWNAVNNLVVSGGEDCKYRVWDCYGRQLYSSIANEYSICSVAWAPNGRYFAVVLRMEEPSPPHSCLMSGHPLSSSVATQ